MRHERLRQNLASATNLLLTDHHATPVDTLALNLFDGDRDSVMLACKPWGAFNMATAWAYEGTDTLQRTFLMGKVTTPREQFHLISEEHRGGKEGVSTVRSGS